MAGLTKIKAGALHDNCVTADTFADNSITGDHLNHSTALPDGVTATTQSAGDNSTKIATTAYADAAGGSGDKIEEGNTSVECIDSGSDGIVRIKTEGSNRLTVANDGFITIPGNIKVADMHIGNGNSSTHNSNTVFGNTAGENLASTAYYNICIGYEGGRGITTGDQNTMIGYRTGGATLTGHDNVGVGNEALQDCTSGYHNVCIGRETGQNLTSGYSNTFIGERAGYAGTVTGNSNVGIGVYAAGALTSGYDNVCIGKNAGVGVTEGYYNICLGFAAGDEITTGDDNICIGNQSAGGLTTGNNNTIIGGPTSGFGSSTSNTVSIGIKGTERMRIDSSGRVGFGTNSPTHSVNISNGTVTGMLHADGSSNFGIGAQTDHALYFYTNDTERGRFTSEGHFVAKNRALVGGHTAPYGSYAGSTNARLSISGYNYQTAAINCFVFGNQTYGGDINLGISNNSTVGNHTLIDSGDTLGRLHFMGSNGTEFKTGARIRAACDTQWTSSSFPTRLEFQTCTSSGSEASEKMRIRENGRIIAGNGYTVNYGGVLTAVDQSSDGTYFSIGRTSSQTKNVYSRDGTGTSSFTHIGFANTSGERGSIVTNGSTTTYNTTSDYRIKENVVTLTGAIDRVKQLAPKRFNFTGETKVVDGFIAHEAQTVVPEAVTGEKDAVDANNEPELQGIDQSKLVPLLTAALQEAITEIETLKTKVAALEAG